MKFLFIFALYLISGPVNCSDVIAYSGGSVIISSNINWEANNCKYICKVKKNACSDIIRAETKLKKIQDGRFKLYSNKDKSNICVLIRNLKPQDAGTYRFGIGNQDNLTVNLIVYNNTYCMVPKIMNAHLGQNLTIACNYPGKYKRNIKYVTTLDDDNFIKTIANSKTYSSSSRFSISDDSYKVFSLHIRNVQETDEMFYVFGVKNEMDSVIYYSYFTEMWLHITVGVTTKIEILSTMCFSYLIVMSVFICMVLLLSGGLALMIFRLKWKTTQGLRPSSRRHIKVNNDEVCSDQRNNLDNLHMSARQNIGERSHSQDSSTNQIYSNYECLNHKTLRESVYDSIQYPIGSDEFKFNS